MTCLVTSPSAVSRPKNSRIRWWFCDFQPAALESIPAIRARHNIGNVLPRPTRSDQPLGGRVERRCDQFRPMASAVSALSSIVANGHQIVPTVPPPPRFIPYGGFSPVPAGSQPSHPAPFRTRPRLRLTQERRFFPFLVQGPGVSNLGCAHRPLAQRGLSSPHLQSLLRPDPPV